MTNTVMITDLGASADLANGVIADVTDVNTTIRQAVNEIRLGLAIDSARIGILALEIASDADVSITPPSMLNMVGDTFDGKKYDTTAGTLAVRQASLDGVAFATADGSVYERKNNFPLFGLWELDSNGNDTTSSNNLAEVNGAISYVTAKISNGADLESGSTQFFRKLAGNYGVTGNTDITIDVWIKPESLPGAGNFTYITSSSNNANHSHYIRIDGNDNLIEVNTTDAAGPGDVTMKSTTAAAAGTWIHIVYTSSSGGSQTLFINGVSENTASGDPLSSPFSGSNVDFRIGADTSNANTFDGIIDNVGLFNINYASAQALFSYNSGSGKDYGNLLNGDRFVHITLPTFAGTVIGTMLVSRSTIETGASITYDIKDTSGDADTSLATDTVNLFSNLDTNPTELILNLVAKSSSPTDANPSIDTYILMVFLDRS